ncbi:hypothetical protein S7711_11520 [Stachybotrys chartarum IBT 7711]|uniref:Uncharacterized protein n=1 Tax=Stachybotrys chartarum (strain CBS 109288 / IBT 7711) TaxID=1280523 RepID=A0A084B525_STACB|nr:hypothetical protein S7711_11520 [Stachybotrys chartarum IBT 7711]
MMNTGIDAQYSLDLQNPQNIFNSEQGQNSIPNTDLASWPWFEKAGSLRERSTVQSRSEIAIGQCPETEQVISRAVAEIRQMMTNLEKRMEKRIINVEKQVDNLQNGLEQEAAKVCSEIEVYIRKLRAWAAEIKMLLAAVAESQQS